VIFRTDLFRCLEKLVSFSGRQRNSLDLRRLRNLRETAESRGRVQLDDAHLDRLVGESMQFWGDANSG